MNPEKSLIPEKNVSLISVARCYSSVFRGPPWYEAYKDEQGNFFGPEYDSNWRQLGLTRAYPLLKTRDYILKEISRPGAQYTFKLCPKQSKVIGFGWGFEYSTITQLVEEKWPSVCTQDKQTLINTILSTTTSQNIWYLSEVGVLPDYQNTGIGSSITTELTQSINLPVIMRTNTQSTMVSIANKLGFTKIPSFQDPINPQRLLFYLPEKL